MGVRAMTAAGVLLAGAATAQPVRFRIVDLTEISQPAGLEQVEIDCARIVIETEAPPEERAAVAGWSAGEGDLPCESAYFRDLAETGYGLTLAHRLAELHGGSLRFTSDPARNRLSWTVLLPVTPPARVVDPAAVLSSASGQSRRAVAGKTVALVIEATAGAGTWATSVLQDTGFTAARVRGEEEALRRAENFDIGLAVICDRNPAEAWRMAARLRSRSSTGHLPLLLISGKGTDAHRLCDGICSVEWPGAVSAIQRAVVDLLGEPPEPEPAEADARRGPTPELIAAIGSAQR